MSAPVRDYRFLQFDPMTGRIVQLSYTPFDIEGLHAALIPPGVESIDGNTTRVDLSSLKPVPYLPCVTCALEPVPEPEK